MKLPSLICQKQSVTRQAGGHPRRACLVVVAAVQFRPSTAHAENPTLSREQDEILSGFASYELNPANAKGDPHHLAKELRYQQRRGSAPPTSARTSKSIRTAKTSAMLSSPGAARRRTRRQSRRSQQSEPPCRRLQRLPPGDGTCGFPTVRTVARTGPTARFRGPSPMARPGRFPPVLAGRWRSLGCLGHQG